MCSVIYVYIIHKINAIMLHQCAWAPPCVVLVDTYIIILILATWRHLPYTIIVLLCMHAGIHGHSILGHMYRSGTFRWFLTCSATQPLLGTKCFSSSLTYVVRVGSAALRKCRSVY